MRLSLRRRASFCHSFATLHRAGIPIIETFATVAAGERPGTLHDALTGMRDALLAGSTLSGALADSGLLAAFDASGAALLSAGEKTGHIAEAFDTIGAAAERDLSIRREVVRAAFYPAVLLVLGCFLLPLRVLILESVSAYLRAALTPLAIFIGVALVCVYATRLLRRHAPRRAALLERLPILSLASRHLDEARAASTLGALLDAGLPIAVALDAAGKASGSTTLELAFARAAAEVAAGETLSSAFGKAGVSPGLHAILHTGEKSGTLPASLRAYAKSEQDAGEHALRLMVRIGTTAFLLGVFLYLGWRSFSQIADVRRSIDQLIDGVDLKNLTPNLSDSLKELQQALE